MKYIIKNCPAYSVCGICVSQEAECLCKDCTDCLLKRIVELSEKNLAFLKYGISEQHLDTAVTSAKKHAKAELAQDILNLLEIEEVDEEK